MRIKEQSAKARQVFKALLMVSIVLVHCVNGIEVTVSSCGGSESSSVGLNLDLASDSVLKCELVIDRAAITPATEINGSISKFEERHEVVDDTGKSASVYVKVVNAKDGLTYSSQVIPKEGWTITQPYVSAEQWLNVPKADSIKVAESAHYGTLYAYMQMEEDKGSSYADYVSLKDYYGKGYASTTQVEALQAAAEASGKSIEIYGDANDGNFSTDTPFWVAGSASSIQGLGAYSSAGTSTQASLSGHINGAFISKATVGTQTKTRTSNYGTEYDLNMRVVKGIAPTGILGYYVDINNPTANKIQGAVNAADPGDIINVVSGRYLENIKIDKPLMVKGAGSENTIVDGNGAGTVFTVGSVNSKVNVTLSDMGIVGGNSANKGGGIFNLANLTVEDSIIFQNTAKNGGAGIYNGGTLKLINNSIMYNSAAKLESPYSLGGGIYNDGTLNMEDNSIDHNYADEGGAIYNSGWGNGGGTTTMTGGTMNNNTARFNGGGIYNDGVFTLNSGTINYNTAMYGGGIFNFGIATQNGGNIDFNKVVEGYDPRQPWVEGGYGGGVYNDENIGSFNLIGGSINHNSAPNSGGGVYNSGHFNLIGGSINYNNALNGGGVISDDESPCIFTMTGGSIDYNVAKKHGGGILNYGPLILKGGSISNNQALTGYGGGIFADWGSQQVTFSGSTAKVQNNKAQIPASESSWYKSWGIYFGNTVPTRINGFNPDTQVLSNSHI